MNSRDAIVVRHACKRFGKGQQILDGLSMTVPKGTIYGLLGASGCGKTTLLSCVVGVKQLDSGDIWVLGGYPGTKGSGIPGPKVGYMPQDISLVQEFSVIGALYYFGRINGMKDSDIEDEYYFLSELLQLPPKNRLIKNMSGGQQRRVSFAAALIHKPELLILDEPTVGLDPILREKIWNFLVKLTQEQGTTVVITTHYIEEAKLANKIGLMRCGKLLAEAGPSQLLDRFQCSTLEEAFLILSQRQKHNREQGLSDIQSNYISESNEFSMVVTPQTESINRNQFFIQSEKIFYNDVEYTKKEIRSPVLALTRFKALMSKNITQFFRHPGGILFAILFPVIQICLFFNSIGGDPKGLNLAIINHEAGNCNFGLNNGKVLSIDPEYKECEFVDLSCRFLNSIEDSFVGKIFYNNTDQISQDVKENKVAGLIYFPKNFSISLQKRVDFPMAVSTSDIISSEIQVSLDMGNRQTGLFLQREIYDRYRKTNLQIISECNISPKYFDSPVRFEKPIHGVLNPNISTYMAPSFILTVIFFLATSVSSSIIISDRHEGVWDRSIVQGVHTSEILIAHILTQFMVVIIQTTLTLSFSFLQFNLQCLGSLTAVIVLVLLMGFCGMCYGFLISVMCTSHTIANYITTGTFYPVILLCGCLWPIEGMPYALKWLSMCLPTTLPAISLRSILDKGYPVNDPQVYNGFLVISGWTAGFIALCLIGLKTKPK